MGNNIFRKPTLYVGAVIAGSTVIDLMRFTPWQDNHNPMVPILILSGLALAYSIGWLTRIILRGGGNDG